MTSPAAPPPAWQPPPPAGRPWYRRPWPIAIGALLLTIIVGTLLAPNETPDPQPDTAAQPTPTTTPTEPSPTPAESPTLSLPPSPAPPAATPSIYNGRGDDVLKIAKPTAGPVLLYVRGNTAGRFFAVDAFDAHGQEISNQINATEPYDGTTLLDIEDGQETSTLQIQATGAWHIEVRPLSMARRFDRAISGRNDDVVTFTNTQTGTAFIKGNATSRYFGINTYTADGERETAVNTTESYSGRVPWPAGPGLAVIQATGLWSITIEQ
jgi:hypothetical protein